MIVSFARFLAGLTRRGWKPATVTEAWNRADVCLKCPLRSDAGFIQECGGALAVVAMRLRSKPAKINMDVIDGKCDACGCSLSAKVWVPDEDIRRTTKPGQFPAWCWQAKAHEKPVDGGG